MQPACPPRSRSTPEPAFTWQLAATPPRWPPPRSPVERGLLHYGIVAPAHSAPPSPATPQAPQATQVSEIRNILVLCAAISRFSAGFGDRFARYRSTVLIRLHHTRNIRPLSSRVSHVPAFPPTPGMPRPLEPQEHQKSLEHQDSLEPQGSRPVCCDIGVFGPHFGPHSEKTQHTPRRSATRHEPPCREGRHRQAASHTSTPVCAAISRKSGPKPGPKLQYRSTVLDTPTKSPPPRPTNASKMQHSASQRHTPQ